MSRESVAKIELDRAYDRLLKNSNLTKELFELLIKEGVKTDEIFNNIKFFSKYGVDTEDLVKNYLLAKERGEVSNVDDFFDNKRDLHTKIKNLEKIGLGINIANDFFDSQNAGRIVVGAIYDGGIMTASRLIPGVGQITLFFDVLNLIDKLSGGDGTTFDLRAQAQNLYDKLTNTTSDLPDLDALKKGILKITMPDGTVYARPLSASFFPYGVTPSRLLTGGNCYTNDVLFGGNENDTLQGGNGSDLLIGGDGFDTYNAGTLDIIRDSDGKGRVFLSSTNIQLTGGTQIEKGPKIYKGKDGTTYELKGSDLIINDSITIENFSKISNDLGIVLVDADDIVVTMGNNQSTDGDNGKHSMEFKITLNRALKKDEFLELIINGQRVKFKEGDIEQTYTHTWDGNTIKEEDRKFEVSASVVTDKSIVKAKLAQAGNETIIDHDREFANLNLLVA